MREEPSPLSREVSPAPSEHASSDASETSSWSNYWTKQLTDLPRELHIKIFTHLDSYRSAVALRLTPQHFNAIYNTNLDSILTALAKDLVAPFKEYYAFLTRLKFPDGCLKHPPPGGWPNITPDVCLGLDKTPFAYKILQHLPYPSQCEGKYGQLEVNIGYKSNPVDYSAAKAGAWRWNNEEVFWATEWQDYFAEDPWEEDDEDRISPLKHIILIADGWYESGGTVLPALASNPADSNIYQIKPNIFT